MNIIEEVRTEVRVGLTTYCVEVAKVPDEGDTLPRVTVIVSAADPAGEPVAEGVLNVRAAQASTLGTIVSDALASFAGVGTPSRRRPGVVPGDVSKPAHQGKPWNEELDADLERRWLAGESVEDIATRFERSPGGIRARLPRVGCDPEKEGAYLPPPPSHRAESAEPEPE